MRTSIGNTWILQLVIIFMLIFVSFLALSLNYTKAYKLKNELVTMIEKYEGLSSKNKKNDGSISLINNYLRFNGYGVMHTCEQTEFGSKNLDDDTLEPVEEGERYYYCVAKIDTSNERLNNRSRYRIKIFFNFNLPVIGDLFTFTVEGTTIDINNAIENDINYFEGDL